jgi:hypothetical protein
MWTLSELYFSRKISASFLIARGSAAVSWGNAKTRNKTLGAAGLGMAETSIEKRE